VGGDTLFFTATDGVHGRELWKSDGTRAGTVLVKNIRPDTDIYNYSSYPSGLTGVGRTLFFSADDGSHGRELWKSDGTRAGTVLVKDINPGPDSAGYYGPTELTDVRGTLFFSADDGVHGRELWKSDGTEAGTAMVIDLPEDYYYRSDPTDLTAVGRRLFFIVDRRAGHGGQGANALWKSDGTESGTVLIKDFFTYSYAYPAGLTDVGGTVFFTVNDNVHGNELWRSDGTDSGTVLVKDINRTPGPYGGYAGSYPSSLTAVRGRLFFIADDGVHGREVWKSDGTRAGTALMRDIHPGAGNSDASFLTGVGRMVFFAADDGAFLGRELWKSDGTRSGTVLVEDINEP
jgi:ELWxxDGT repeat protein